MIGGKTCSRIPESLSKASELAAKAPVISAATNMMKNPQVIIKTLIFFPEKIRVLV